MNTSQSQISQVSVKSILQEIKSSTPKSISQELFATFKLLKRNQLTADQVHDRVKVILKEYPHLIERLDPTIAPKQISPALEFVTKIKNVYAEQPHVYERFTLLLREYQRQIKTKNQVKEEVDVLLADRPDLIQEFDLFYNEPKMVRNDSNDTLPEVVAEHVVQIEPVTGETQPLIARQSKSYVTHWVLFFTGMVLSGMLVAAYFLGYLNLLWDYFKSL